MLAKLTLDHLNLRASVLGRAIAFSIYLARLMLGNFKLGALDNLCLKIVPALQ
jgi:hypothetical protein